jgi:hypothetical protein
MIFTGAVMKKTQQPVKIHEPAALIIMQSGKRGPGEWQERKKLLSNLAGHFKIEL